MENQRIVAAKNGEGKYVGSPCKHCGATKRYVISGNCVACSGIRAKQSRNKVRDTLNAARGGALDGANKDN